MLFSSVRPRRAVRKATTERFPRIRVIERPGAEHESQAHDLDSVDCWCEPVLEDIGSAYVIEHRAFEN